MNAPMSKAAVLAAKQNWFPTLNAALDAEGLVDRWPVGVNINYGETVNIVSGGKFITVYRDEGGRYERPVHYATKAEDTYPNRETLS